LPASNTNFWSVFMSMWKKVAGFACGASAVGALGLALAQGQPPDPRVPNPATGAGQQSTFHTGMGETGLPPWNRQIPVAVITKEPEPVAVAPAPPPPAPVAVAPAPAPAPEPAATMGAPPEPPARADRN
jgi:hypothetical protein